MNYQIAYPPKGTKIKIFCWLMILACMFALCTVGAASIFAVFDNLCIFTFAFTGANLGYTAAVKHGTCRSAVVLICLFTGMLCAFGGGAFVRDIVLLNRHPIFLNDTFGILLAFGSILACYVYRTWSFGTRICAFTDSLIDNISTFVLPAFMNSVYNELSCNRIMRSICGFGTILTIVICGWIITVLLYRDNRSRLLTSLSFTFLVCCIEVFLTIARMFNFSIEEEFVIWIFLNYIFIKTTWGLLCQSSISSDFKIYYRVFCPSLIQEKCRIMAGLMFVNRLSWSTYRIILKSSFRRIPIASVRTKWFPLLCKARKISGIPFGVIRRSFRRRSVKTYLRIMIA